MEEFLSITVLGLSTAAIFALAASGLVLTYTTTGIFNFAHGAIGMLGAFTLLAAARRLGLADPARPRDRRSSCSRPGSAC